MARKPKREKTVSENLIKKVWLDTKKGTEIKTEEQMIVIAAINKTLHHFDMEDYLYGGKHGSIFIKLYLSAEYGKKQDKRKVVNKKTKIGLAQDLYLGENTIGRYSDNYIKCFDKYFNDQLKLKQ